MDQEGRRRYGRATGKFDSVCCRSFSNLMIAVSDADPPLSTRSNLASTIHRLSQRLGAAQRSIRPLEAVAWGEEIELRFLRDKGRELPAVSRDTYRCQPLPFDPRRKLDEL